MRTRTIGICALGLVAFALHAAPAHTLLLQEAAAFAQAGDQPAALAKLEAAALLRPDYPRIQINLARFCTEAKRPADALAALQRLAAMGVALNISQDPVLASLQDQPQFEPLAKELAAPLGSVGTVTATAFSSVDGILENLLIDPATGDWYLSDVRNRCIWRREAHGALQRFTSPADELDGVFKLALSPDRKVLWAATAAVGVMNGTPAGEGSRSALVALDFTTGRVLSRHAVPADSRKHLLGDFIFAPDGSLFATDSYSPVIWRLPRGAAALEPWLESGDFLNLQGLAFSADGGTLYVADYSNGLWRVDVATKKVDRLVAPPNATFFGIDGLYALPSGLLAIQNGVNPQRVLHISPAANSQPSPTRVVAAGHPAMVDLSLGTVEDTRFHFIADSGWALFDPAPTTPPPARAVTVLSFAIE